MVSKVRVVELVIGAMLFQVFAVADDSGAAPGFRETSFPVRASREYEANVERLMEIVEQETPRPDAPRETVEAINALGDLRAILAVRALIPWLAIRPTGGLGHSDLFDRHYTYPAAAALVEIGGPARSSLSAITYDPKQSELARETACWCLLEIEGNLTDEEELEWSREIVLICLRRYLEPPFSLNDEERATLQKSIDYILNYQVAAELVWGPVFETYDVPNGVVGEPYQADILIGPAPENPAEQALSMEVALDSTLPNGLSLDPVTQTITGIPEMAGEFSFTVRATSRVAEPPSVDSYDSFRTYTILIE